MIKLLNKDGSLIGRFDGEGDLFSYIVQETASAADREDMGDWRFTYSSHQHLERLVREIGNKSLVFMAYQACQQKRALITLATGDAQNPVFLIATPELDIAALRRKWCKMFCVSHGLRIVIG